KQTETTSEGPSPQTGGEKKLTRSASDKKIAGICGGMANYFHVDATLVRVLWLIAALGLGFPFLAYVVLWIFLPLSSGELTQASASTLGAVQSGSATNSTRSRIKTSIVITAALILVVLSATGFYFLS